MNLLSASRVVEENSTDGAYTLALHKKGCEQTNFQYRLNAKNEATIHQSLCYTRILYKIGPVTLR